MDMDFYLWLIKNIFVCECDQQLFKDNDIFRKV